MRIRALFLALLLSEAAHPQAASKPQLIVGDTMPSVSAQQVSGDIFTLGQQLGKVVVVNIWGTWCVPCKYEIPGLEKQIWQKYKSSPDFAMIAIAAEESKRTIAHFQKKHPDVTFPLAFDGDRAVFKLFPEHAVPRTYVVDRHGVIVFKRVGYAPNNVNDLDQAIQAALSEP